MEEQTMRYYKVLIFLDSLQSHLLIPVLPFIVKNSLGIEWNITDEIIS